MVFWVNFDAESPPQKLIPTWIELHVETILIRPTVSFMTVHLAKPKLDGISDFITS